MMSDTPHPVDVHVGARVRARRRLLGITQEKLGESLGLTFQQVQKYERGSNRISASRLFELARVLSVPVSYFYEGAEAAAGDVHAIPAEAAAGVPDASQLASRETNELLRCYYRLGSPLVRRRVLDLLRALAQEEHGELEEHDGHSLPLAAE